MFRWVIAIMCVLVSAGVRGQTGDTTPILTMAVGATVHDLVFSPDGQQLAVAAGDAVLLWETTTGELIQRQTLDNAVRRLHYLPDGSRLITLVEPDLLIVWDHLLSREQGRFQHWYGITDFALAPDGDTIAAAINSPYFQKTSWISTFSLEAALDGTLRTMNDLTQDIDTLGQWHTVAFSPDGAYLAAGLWHDGMGRPSEIPEQGQVYLWETATMGLPRAYATPLAYQAPITQIIVRDDTLLAASHLILGWELQSGTFREVSQGYLETGLAVQGDYLVTAGMTLVAPQDLPNARTLIHIYDWRSGEKLASFQRESATPISGASGTTPALIRVPVAVHGSLIASADPDGVISLWQIDFLGEESGE